MATSSKDPSPPLLDHIVLLLPHQTLAALPPWLTSEFTILVGGRHADGLTENKLVVLADGTYLELIAFVDGLAPEDRLRHKWGRKPDGAVIDWACSLAAAADDDTAEAGFPAVQDRVRAAQSLAVYEDPVPGGRIRPDGEELRWAVAVPAAAADADADADAEDRVGGGDSGRRRRGVERGELPFWCFDRTPRELRVPSHIPANVEHPSGAVGVCSIAVEVSSDELGNAYAGITGQPATEEEGGGGGAGGKKKRRRGWAFDVPVRRFDDPRYVYVETVAGGGEEEEEEEEVADRVRGRTGRQGIRLALYTSAGSAKRTIGGDLGAGVSVEIELVPVSGGSGGSV